jgi:N-acetylmuramoyl-L-alanine amidase
MSVYKWLIDAGHGGIVNGKYKTAPRKMFVFPDGLVIYEGVINRLIADKLAKKLSTACIDWKFIHDEDEDDSLLVRVNRADAEFAKDKRCVFLSIHSNAGGGHGNEIYTSKGQTKSDKVAQIFCETYEKCFPNFRFRSDQTDGDADKESDFYVLRKTDCPALLVENLFFDNRKEAEFLLSPEGQEKFADCLFQCILNVERLKPI